MVNDLHTNLLKYLAIIGLVPYMIRSNGQRKQKREQQQQHVQYLVAFKQHHYQHQHQQQRHRQRQHQRQPISNHHNRTLRWQQIYTGALIAINMITTLFGVIFLPFEDTLFVTNVVSIIVFLVQIAVVNSILLETMLTYKKYCELLNNYQRVQTLMKQLLQIQLCKREIRQRQWRKYSFYIMIVYGSLLATATVISTNYYCGYFWYALLAIFTIRTRSIQITLYMDYIVYYLELFNIKLKALVSCKLYKNYTLLDIDYKHLESFEYLSNVKYVYQEIYALHEKYNELYGQSLVSIYTVIVLDIIIHVYWTFLTLFEYYKTYFMYKTISSLTALFTILFMLCYTGEQCEKQVKVLLTYQIGLECTNHLCCFFSYSRALWF